MFSEGEVYLKKMGRHSACLQRQLLASKGSYMTSNHFCASLPPGPDASSADLARFYCHSEIRPRADRPGHPNQVGLGD